MLAYLFQNRIRALMFVVATLIGAAALIGTQDEKGALTAATEQIAEQGRELRGEADGFAMPVENPEPTMIEADQSDEFASDGDLVVDPVGMNPTPSFGDQVDWNDDGREYRSEVPEVGVGSESSEDSDN